MTIKKIFYSNWSRWNVPVQTYLFLFSEIIFVNSEFCPFISRFWSTSDNNKVLYNNTNIRSLSECKHKVLCSLLLFWIVFVRQWTLLKGGVVSTLCNECKTVQCMNLVYWLKRRLRCDSGQLKMKFRNGKWNYNTFEIDPPCNALFKYITTATILHDEHPEKQCTKGR